MSRKAGDMGHVRLASDRLSRPRIAAVWIALHGHRELVELFLEHGIDVNARNNKNDTPVLWAARGNHVDAVRLLIRRGADLQLENDKGSTPLYWAVRYGFADLVKVLLLEGHADVGQRRKLGLVTPIVLAAALQRNRDGSECLSEQSLTPHPTQHRSFRRRRVGNRVWIRLRLCQWLRLG